MRRGLYTLAQTAPCAAPLVLEGKVAQGFGRGGKLLGCPTANLDDADVGDALDTFGTGVYFGWARLHGEVYKMATSIGWNPFFKNDKKTVEPHILHAFEEDFYGETLAIVVCGKIRPELNFDSMDALVAAIENDKRISAEALDMPQYQAMKALLPK